jgi:spore germination protein GerM
MAERRGKKTSNGAGCLIWFVVLAVVVGLFILSYPKIEQTLKDTRFFDVIGRGDDTKPDAEPGTDTVTVIPSAEDPGEGVAVESLPEGQTPEDEGAPTLEGQDDVPSPEAGSDAPETKPDATDSSSGQQPGASAEVKRMVVSLWFVVIGDDGSLARMEVKRSLPRSDTPLADTIKALLIGPSADELGKNMQTLIPLGTKLRSVRMSGTTAVIDLSEEFMFNRYGIEGYAAQLKQLVWTATSFSTVHDVQILIEGQRRDFLGGEGVYIGKPLSRASFN